MVCWNPSGLSVRDAFRNQWWSCFECLRLVGGFGKKLGNHFLPEMIINSQEIPFWSQLWRRDGSLPNCPAIRYGHFLFLVLDWISAEEGIFEIHRRPCGLKNPSKLAGISGNDRNSVIISTSKRTYRTWLPVGARWFIVPCGSINLTVESFHHLGTIEQYDIGMTLRCLFQLNWVWTAELL